MDIVESLSTLQIIYQIASLTPWLVNYKNGSFLRSRFLEVFTCVVIVVSTGILFYGLFGYRVLITFNMNEIGDTVDFIQLVGIRVAHIVSITEALFRREDQKVFYDHLKEIDYIFERSLNVDVDNG